MTPLRSIGRAQVNALREDMAGAALADEVDIRVWGGVNVGLSGHDGFLDASVLPRERGLDVHAGMTEVIFGDGRVAVLRAVGPYPIERWDVLWEGECSRRS